MIPEYVKNLEWLSELHWAIERILYETREHHISEHKQLHVNKIFDDSFDEFGYTFEKLIEIHHILKNSDLQSTLESVIIE